MKKHSYTAVLIVIGLAFLSGAILWLVKNLHLMEGDEIVITPEPRASPLPWTTDECITWREVTSQMEGQTVCVYGTIMRIKDFIDTESGEPGPRDIYFSDLTRTGLSEEPYQIHFSPSSAAGLGAYPSVQVGDCVYVRGVLYAAGFIDSEILPGECESWMNSE